jgi:hypothetical protein
MKKQIESKWYSYLTENTKIKINEILDSELIKLRLEKHLTKKKSKQLEHIFDGKDRISIPLVSGENNARDKQMLEYIKEIQAKLGWNVDLTQPFGYATKTVQSTVGDKVYNNKKRVKIGPLFKELDPEAEEFWIKNAKFYTTKENELYFTSQYQIIISRVPIDILRMSDMDNWNSCHGVQGSYFKCAVQESVAGGAVAYVVKKEDLENINLESPEIFSDKDRGSSGIQPLSRIRIRRIVDRNSEADLGAPEERIYGASFPSLYENLKNFLFAKQEEIIKQHSQDGDFNLTNWTLTGGTYEDNDFWELMEEFLKNTEYRSYGENRGSSGMFEDEEYYIEKIKNTNPTVNPKEVRLAARVVNADVIGGAIEFGGFMYFTIKQEFPKLHKDLYRNAFFQTFQRSLPYYLYKYLRGMAYSYSNGISRFTFTLGPEDNIAYHTMEACETFFSNIRYGLILKYRDNLSILVKQLRGLGHLENPYSSVKSNLLVLNSLDGRYMAESKRRHNLRNYLKFEDIDIPGLSQDDLPDAKRSFDAEFEALNLSIGFRTFLSKKKAGELVLKAFFESSNQFGSQKSLNLNENSIAENSEKHVKPQFSIEVSEDWSSVNYHFIAWCIETVVDGEIYDVQDYIDFVNFITFNYTKINNFIYHCWAEFLEEKKQKFIENIAKTMKVNSHSEDQFYTQHTLPLGYETKNWYDDLIAERKQKIKITIAKKRVTL